VSPEEACSHLVKLKLRPSALHARPRLPEGIGNHSLRRAFPSLTLHIMMPMVWRRRPRPHDALLQLLHPGDQHHQPPAWHEHQRHCDDPDRQVQDQHRRLYVDSSALLPQLNSFPLASLRRSTGPGAGSFPSRTKCVRRLVAGELLAYMAFLLANSTPIWTVERMTTRMLIAAGLLLDCFCFADQLYPFVRVAMLS
jgi:hypothetical protein